jgi:hypothetical protein
MNAVGGQLLKASEALDGGEQQEGMYSVSVVPGPTPGQDDRICIVHNGTATLSA